VEIIDYGPMHVFCHEKPFLMNHERVDGRRRGCAGVPRMHKVRPIAADAAAPLDTVPTSTSTS
jgi:hypothetical protein